MAAGLTIDISARNLNRSGVGFKVARIVLIFLLYVDLVKGHTACFRVGTSDPQGHFHSELRNH